MSEGMKSSEREAYYKKISADCLTPLWSVMSRLVTQQPASGCMPYLWNYQAARKHLIEAGTLISAKEAERRVLVMENPGFRGQSKITSSLYAGLQLVNPGEIAPAHRHTQTALRFVMEGEGAYTVVAGEKTRMSVGDLVITPNWAWHDHRNESDQPMIWLDGLDIPLVQFLDTSFAEMLGTDRQSISRAEGDSMARYGEGMLPVDHTDKSLTSPIFNYPYDRTREALEVMRKQNQWDSCHGLKMQYINPVTGDYAMLFSYSDRPVQQKLGLWRESRGGQRDG